MQRVEMSRTLWPSLSRTNASRLDSVRGWFISYYLLRQRPRVLSTTEYDPFVE